MRISKAFLLLLWSVMMIASCSEEQRLNFKDRGREVPDFNADSAYHFVERQLGFGPRNPGSEGHRLTKDYLLNKLRQYAGQKNVFAQEFTHKGYGGETLKLTNIIAAFNPGNRDRVMLCAHWDTRPRADKDSLNTDKPIPGADDGASGVAVLLELARLMSNKHPGVGIDIILFDGEDYGREGSLERYFLGSRYWSNNPPVQGYNPRFGILLDMVGGKSALFPKEKYSLQYAPALVNEIWSIAAEKGYGDIFIDREGVFISDDHVVINRIVGIPTIDIIHHKPDSEQLQFASYWHTHKDNLKIIDRKTLEAVGVVMAELMFNRL